MENLLGVLTQAGWLTWVGVAGVVLLHGLCAILFEHSRRKTYRTLLTANEDGALLMDRGRGGRILLVIYDVSHSDLSLHQVPALLNRRRVP